MTASAAACWLRGLLVEVDRRRRAATLSRVRAALAALALLAVPASASDAPPRLASTRLTVFNLPAEAGEFYANHLAQRLVLSGVRVVTSSEVAALLGLERQKELLGCADQQSCAVELGNALGVDGLVVGDLGKVGDRYQLNVKVLGTRDGALLSAYAGSSSAEGELLELLDAAAESMGPEVAEKLGKPLAPHGFSRPRNTVSVNPAAIYFGYFTGEYERAVASRLSVFGTAAVMANARLPFEEARASGVQVGVGLRYFPGANAPAGIFAAAQLAAVAGFVTGAEESSAMGGMLLVGGGYAFVARNLLYFLLGGLAGPFVARTRDSTGAERTAGGISIEPRIALGATF